MDGVANPHNSVLYGKYQCVDRDGRVKHPKGLESFVIHRQHSLHKPVVIPAQIAVNWPEDCIAGLERHRMNDRDFLLTVAPKAGTHWMWEMMQMLASGQAKYTEEPKHFSWFEYKGYSDILARKQEHPRVLNTHLTLSQLPPGFVNPNTKTVTCMRNPKDVLVSLYFHCRNFAPRVNGSQFISFDDMFDFLLYSKYVPFGRTLDHYADIWDKYRDDPNVLIVFYEDVKERTEEIVKLVADHMGVSYTEQLIEDITSAMDIKAMKKGKHPSEQQFRKRYGQNASLYRKGEIGDWKNHFSAEQNKKFDRIFKQWNSQREIPFRFEPSVTIEE